MATSRPSRDKFSVSGEVPSSRRESKGLSYPPLLHQAGQAVDEAGGVIEAGTDIHPFLPQDG